MDHDVMMTVSLRKEGSPEYFYEACIMTRCLCSDVYGATQGVGQNHLGANINKVRPTKFHQDNHQISALRERMGKRY